MLVVHNGSVSAPGNTRSGDVLCGNARARARSALHDALPLSVIADDATAIVYATHLEACAAAYSMNNYSAYMSMMYRIVFNLKTNGENILTSYPVGTVCRVSHKRLRAETVHAQRDAVVERRLQELLKNVQEVSEAATQMAANIQTEDTLKCPKCKTADGIAAFSEQLRSGDEGMTTRYLCRCGNRWKGK